MVRLAWEEPDLAGCLKNDPRKLAIAVRLRNETTLPIKWIAARLQMVRPRAPGPCYIVACNTMRNQYVNNSSSNLWFDKH